MTLKTAFLISAFSLTLFGASANAANQEIYFDPFPKGPLAGQVDKLWRKEAAYQDYIKAFDMVPDYMIGQYDMNGDGKPEVFARHSDPDLGFCDENGICDMIVYANTKIGLVEIGRMKSGEPVIAAERRNRGVRDLMVTGEGGIRKTYLWNGKSYEPK